MSRQLVDAELRGFYPSNSGSTPDYTIASTDIQSVDHEQRVGTLKDTGEFTVHNNDGSQADTITSGDRIEFHTQLDGEGSLTRRWTVMARKIKREREHGQDGTVSVQVGDYVSEILAMRTATGSFENAQIAGSADSILDTLLASNCPEIDTSGVSTITETTTVTFDGTPMMRVLQELLTRAGYVAWSDDRTLHVDDLSAPTVSFDLNENDKSAWHTVEENDDNLINRARVKGGVQFAKDEDAPAETPTDYVTVTSGDRAVEKQYTTKSTVARLEVYTRHVSASDSDLIVRIQTPNANGSGPRNVNNPDADITRTTIDSSDIVDGGWTTVDFSDHELPTQDIFFIFEGSTPNGVEIGTDGDASDFVYGWGAATPGAAPDAPWVDGIAQLETGKWLAKSSTGVPEETQMPRLQRARERCGVAVVDGDIYVFGGFIDNGAPEDSIEVLYSDAEEFVTLGETLTTPMGGMGCVHHPGDGMVYLLGGSSIFEAQFSGAWDWNTGSTQAYDTIQQFDPEDETISVMSETTPTADPVKAWYWESGDGLIHAITTRTESYSDNRVYFRYQPETGTVKTVITITESDNGFGIDPMFVFNPNYGTNGYARILYPIASDEYRVIDPRDNAASALTFQIWNYTARDLGEAYMMEAPQGRPFVGERGFWFGQSTAYMSNGRIQSWKPTANEWNYDYFPTLPEAKVLGGATVAGDYVYYVGGISLSGPGDRVQVLKFK